MFKRSLFGDNQNLTTPRGRQPNSMTSKKNFCAADCCKPGNKGEALPGIYSPHSSFYWPSIFPPKAPYANDEVGWTTVRYKKKGKNAKKVEDSLPASH